MRCGTLITISIFALFGCHSVIQRQDFVGTYFRVPTVHDEPSGRLVLSKNGHYSFFSDVPNITNSATGEPFSSEDYGSWTADTKAIILHPDGGEEEKLPVVRWTPQIELEWKPSILMKKEPNQSPDPAP
jgi:hypothetical protein